MFFARAVGQNGKVIAFEPNPQNYEEASYNINLNNFSNIKLFSMAIGKGKERSDFAIDPIYPTRGTFETSRKTEILKRNKSMIIDVSVFPLDQIIKEENLRSPDFIKIDVEGLELEALMGMEETIDKSHPALFIELHEINSDVLINWLIQKKYNMKLVEHDLDMDHCDLTNIKKGHLYCLTRI